jgi:hypothetical protein
MAGAGVGHGLRNGERVYPVQALPVDVPESYVLGRLAAHARTRDNRGLLAQVIRPDDARIGDCFAGRYHGELREAIQKIGALVVEMRGVRVAGDLGAVLEAKARAIDQPDRPNP